MNKLIAPKKPTKQDLPPVQTIYQEKYICYRDNEIYLSDDRYDNNIMSYGLTGKMLKQLIELLGEEFEISYNVVLELYYVEFRINNEKYEEEMKVFNDRFNQYQKALAQYQKDLAIYENANKALKIAKLKEELNKLENS